MDLVNHVLGHFNKDDAEVMKESFTKAAQATVMMLGGDIEKAMNIYNTKPKKEKKENKESAETEEKTEESNT